MDASQIPPSAKLWLETLRRIPSKFGQFDIHSANSEILWQLCQRDAFIAFRLRLIVTQSGFPGRIEVIAIGAGDFTAVEGKEATQRYLEGYLPLQWQDENGSNHAALNYDFEIIDACRTLRGEDFLHALRHGDTERFKGTPPVSFAIESRKDDFPEQSPPPQLLAKFAPQQQAMIEALWQPGALTKRQFMKAVWAATPEDEAFNKAMVRFNNRALEAGTRLSISVSGKTITLLR